MTPIAEELGLSEAALRTLVRKVSSENEKAKPMSLEEQLKLFKGENEELKNGGGNLKTLCGLLCKGDKRKMIYQFIISYKDSM